MTTKRFSGVLDQHLAVLHHLGVSLFFFFFASFFPFFHLKMNQKAENSVKNVIKQILTNKGSAKHPCWLKYTTDYFYQFGLITLPFMLYLTDNFIQPGVRWAASFQMLFANWTWQVLQIIMKLQIARGIIFNTAHWGLHS